MIASWWLLRLTFGVGGMIAICVLLAIAAAATDEDKKE